MSEPEAKRPALRNEDGTITTPVLQASLPDDILVDIVCVVYQKHPLIKLASKVLENYFTGPAADAALDGYTRWERDIWRFKSRVGIIKQLMHQRCCLCHLMRIPYVNPGSWATDWPKYFHSTPPPIDSPRLFRVFQWLVECEFLPIQSLDSNQLFTPTGSGPGCKCIDPSMGSLGYVELLPLWRLMPNMYGYIFAPTHVSELGIMFNMLTTSASSVEMRYSSGWCQPVRPGHQRRANPFHRLAEWEDKPFRWHTHHIQTLKSAIAEGVTNFLDYFKYYLLHPLTGTIWNQQGLGLQLFTIKEREYCFKGSTVVVG